MNFRSSRWSRSPTGFLEEMDGLHIFYNKQKTSSFSTARRGLLEECFQTSPFGRNIPSWLLWQELDLLVYREKQKTIRSSSISRWTSGVPEQVEVAQIFYRNWKAYRTSMTNIRHILFWQEGFQISLWKKENLQILFGHVLYDKNKKNFGPALTCRKPKVFWKK